MQPFDRGLILLYTFLVTIIFLATVPFLAGWADPTVLFGLYSRFPNLEEVVYVVVGLFVLAGGRLFFSSLKTPHKQVIVEEGALGKVRVSTAAIEDLVEKTVLQNSGVREARAGVLAHPDGVGIRVRAAVTPDANIPELSRTIQEQIKERVLAVTGIAARQVDVFVHSITARKQRVE